MTETKSPQWWLGHGTRVGRSRTTACASFDQSQRKPLTIIRERTSSITSSLSSSNRGGGGHFRGSLQSRDARVGSLGASSNATLPPSHVDRLSLSCGNISPSLTNRVGNRHGRGIIVVANVDPQPRSRLSPGGFLGRQSLPSRKGGIEISPLQSVTIGTTSQELSVKDLAHGPNQPRTLTINASTPSRQGPGPEFATFIKRLSRSDSRRSMSVSFHARSS